MHESLTWQTLPSAFLEPVLLGLVLLMAASELWDLWLTTPNGQTLAIPQRLQPAAHLIFQQDVIARLTLH